MKSPLAPLWQRGGWGDAASPSRSPFLQWYFLGAGLAQWSAWQASTAVGIALGTQIPPGWALDFTVALTFIALVVPALWVLQTVLPR